MKTSLAFVFALFSVISAVEYEKDGDVLVLTDDNIADAIKENEYLLVEFYAPWCGHCKSLAPEYAKAATALSQLDTPVALAKVDATEQSKSAQEYGVQGYPTLKWFVNGKASEYGGGRTESEIVSWIKKRTGPPCKELADADAVEEFKKSADVVVVAFVATDSDDFKQVESAARSVDDVSFGVADSSLSEKFGGKLMLFKTFDEGQSAFEGDMTEEAILEFVQGNMLPLVSVFSQEAAAKIFGSGVDNHMLYFNDEKADSHEGIMKELAEVAKEYKGKTLFVFVPASEDRVLSYFDFSADDLPKAILVALGDGDMKKYGFNKELTAANMKAHVEAYHSGEIKPTLKSEDPPADNSGNVKVVVGTNFEEIVLDESKDVLLEFYAPWCGHCKALTPTWEELGDKYAKQDSIVIAKVDATANDIDHPGVSVRGFPTILFFPAGDKTSPQTYEGGRDLDSFVQFLEENASTLDKEAAGGGKMKEDL